MIFPDSATRRDVLCETSVALEFSPPIKRMAFLLCTTCFHLFLKKQQAYQPTF
jgi:hypothetical protein